MPSASNKDPMDNDIMSSLSMVIAKLCETVPTMSVVMELAGVKTRLKIMNSESGYCTPIVLLLYGTVAVLSVFRFLIISSLSIFLSSISVRE